MKHPPDDAVLIGRLADEVWSSLETLRILRRTARASHYAALTIAIRVLDEYSRDLGRQLGRVNRHNLPSTLREIEAAKLHKKLAVAIQTGRDLDDRNRGSQS
jgi:hypothetical protein